MMPSGKFQWLGFLIIATFVSPLGSAVLTPPAIHQMSNDFFVSKAAFIGGVHDFDIGPDAIHCPDDIKQKRPSSVSLVGKNKLGPTASWLRPGRLPPQCFERMRQDTWGSVPIRAEPAGRRIRLNRKTVSRNDLLHPVRDDTTTERSGPKIMKPETLF